MLSHRDCSHEGPQQMFSLRNNDNYLRIILKTSPYLELCYKRIFLGVSPKMFSQAVITCICSCLCILRIGKKCIDILLELFDYSLDYGLWIDKVVEIFHPFQQSIRSQHLITLTELTGLLRYELMGECVAFGLLQAQVISKFKSFQIIIIVSKFSQKAKVHQQVFNMQIRQAISSGNQ